MTEMTQEQIALWVARCKAWNDAHKHQWHEPWAFRAQKAQEAYDQAIAKWNERKEQPHD